MFRGNQTSFIVSQPMNSYTYSILRFTPDIRTGEFINVGIAAYSAANKLALIRCRNTVGRVTKLNHAVNGHGLVRMLKAISKEFDARSGEISGELEFTKIKNVSDICHMVLPRDDSALQWSEIRFGKCKALDAEIDRLYERFVTYADVKNVSHKTDEDLWRVFSKELETRNLKNLFKEKTFKTSDDEVTFDKSVKNGIWHCVQPVSFDLMHATSIKDKAHKWLGQISSVKDQSDKFKLYFLVAQPGNPELMDSYENARSILDKIPSEKAFYTEEESGDLAEQLEAVARQ